MTEEETAETVAELQYKTRRLAIVAVCVLVLSAVTAVVFLDALGHFQDVKQIAGVLSPAFSAAVIVFVQYRNSKTSLTAQGKVLQNQSSDGPISHGVERAVTKVALSQEFQDLVVTRVADQIIQRASVPVPGGRRKGDPPAS